jgi:hypothetical protein
MSGENMIVIIKILQPLYKRIVAGDPGKGKEIFLLCQCKVEMSPILQSRDDPFARDE